MPDITGAIARRENITCTTTTIYVPSAEDLDEKVVQAGGKVPMPIAAISGMGYLGSCAHTEGNVFGILQHDPGTRYGVSRFLDTPRRPLGLGGGRRWR